MSGQENGAASGPNAPLSLANYSRPPHFPLAFSPAPYYNRYIGKNEVFLKTHQNK